jgi:hypothetical protein
VPWLVSFDFGLSVCLVLLCVAGCLRINCPELVQDADLEDKLGNSDSCALLAYNHVEPDGALNALESSQSCGSSG